MRRNWLVAVSSAAVLLVAGVASSCDGDDESSQKELATVTASAGASVAPASKDRSQVLTEAINEEYKARATYQAVIDKFGQVAPFTNILNAENTHVQQWAGQFERLGLAVPADPFAGKVAAPATVALACAAGVAAEKDDVALYDRLMKETTDQTLLTIMTQQRKVSQENHLPAFERCN